MDNLWVKENAARRCYAQLGNTLQYGLVYNTFINPL